MLSLRSQAGALLVLALLFVTPAAFAETKKIRITEMPKNELHGLEHGAKIPDFFIVTLRPMGKVFDEAGKEIELKSLKPTEVVMVTYSGSSKRLLQASKIERIQKR